MRKSVVAVAVESPSSSSSSASSRSTRRQPAVVPGETSRTSTGVGSGMDGKILRMPLKASVIVPTRGRPRYLRVALESLAAQDLEPDAYEVVVVDDGPDAETRAAVQQVAAVSRAPLRYVERAGVPGLNSARNTGIAAAESDLIVFVDDDVEAPPEWLRELVAGRARHPEAL